MTLTHQLCRITLVSVVLSFAIAGCATTHSPSTASAPARAKRSEDANSPTRLAHSFDEAVRRGDAAWHDHNTDLALYLYVQALSFQPRDIDTLGKIGSIHEALGNLDPARKAFELAATTAPDDARVTSHLGLLLLTQGDLDGADTWLRKCVAVDASDWHVYDALGTIAQRRGHYDDALMFLQRATNLAPTAPGPLLHRGSVQFAKGDYAVAETTLQKALELKQTSDAWRLLGEVQAHRGEYQKAVTSLLQALDVPAAYNEVGRVALGNHDNQVAFDYFVKATESSPVYFEEAQRNAALARERLGAVITARP